MSISALIDVVTRDIRISFRMLAKRPGFTAIVILTLALGIGANAAIFSIVDAVILKPLPFKNPAQLTAVWETNFKQLRWSKMFVSYRDFEAWQHDNHTFQSLAAYTWAVPPARLTGKSEPRDMMVIPASVDFFALLGTSAALGRTFQPSDLQNPNVIVLSHAGWVSLFGGDPAVVNSTVLLDDQPCTVVGVMPASFEMYPKQTQGWSLLTTASPVAKDPMNHILAVVGRLNPGSTLRTAQDDISLARTRVNQQNPDPLSDMGVSVNDLQEDYTWFAGRNLKSALLVLFGAVVLVLMIGCVNVANLMLARAADRSRELAIRTALGSSRARLMGQLLTESLTLAAIGAAIGVLLASALIRWFNSAAPIELPPDSFVALNGRVVAFSAILAVIAAMLFGSVPALQATRVDLNSALKETGRSASGTRASRRYSNALVAAEIALALILVAGASLLIETVVRFGRVNVGFDSQNLLTMDVKLPERQYSKPEQISQYYDRLLESLRALPGVMSASALQWLPVKTGGGSVGPLTVNGRPAVDPAQQIYDVAQDRIAPGLFQTMGIQLLRGRLIEESDRLGTENVAVVSESLVRKYFPGEDPLGKQIRVGSSTKRPWLTIVGVVGDVDYNNVFKEMSKNAPPVAYTPLSQSPTAEMSIVIRTSVAPASLTSEAAAEVRKLDPGLTRPETLTMDRIIADSLAQPEFRAVLAAVFAGLALFLAAIGIYGVISQSVSRRTQEIGIRMALGATRTNVIRMIFREGLTLSLVGTIAGLCGAIASTSLLTSLLFDVHPGNPVRLALVAAFLVGIAMLACYIPARRATSVDPSTSLRYE